ncbi:PilL protein [plant metagenome]|uniref:PilL protein n=1 Tax=plant metagenome TaxID=1297885 RepID=A0A484Q5H2_9ZZZZ
MSQPFCPAPLAMLRMAACCLAVAVLGAGCATTTPRDARPDLADAPVFVPEPVVESVPVVRYGRYTLVELVPDSAQRDLLLQIVDVSIPDTLHATVGDALTYVLLRSGYRACAGGGASAFQAMPLPASHYRLGPLVLRDALLTLAGPAWDLQVDDGARQVCFVQAVPPVPFVDPPVPSALPAEPVVEVFPVPSESQP